MTKIRIEKSGYTIVGNDLLRDSNLSLKAKGLACFMLSLPDTWDYSVEGLTKVLKEGKDAIRTCILELEKSNYLTREKRESEKGKFSMYDYVLKDSNRGGLSVDGFSAAVNPQQINKEEQLKTNKENYIKEIEDIFLHWNRLDIVNHKKLSDDIKEQIKKNLKKYTLKEIKDAISRYSIIIKDKEFFFNYKWSLHDFLKRATGISSFTEDGSMTANYKSQRKPSKEGESKWKLKT